MKTFSSLILVFFICSCTNSNVKLDSKCDVDSLFANCFINDLSTIMKYRLNQINSDQAFKSFVNLEVITKGKNNLDELGATFYDDFTVIKEFDSLLFDWFNWYQLNKCYTLSMALDRFEEVAAKNPLPNYKEPMVINKLLEKQPYFDVEGTKFSTLSEAVKIDSLGRLSMLPDWECAAPVD